MKIDLSKPWAGMVPISRIVRNPDQPRKTFPKAELDALAQSMRVEDQVTPCAVMPKSDVRVGGERGTEVTKWLLIDGEMRWRAAQLAGKDEVLVCYRPGVTVENLHLVSFAANFCRTPHTKHETALAIDKEHSSGRTYEEIGQIVGKTDGWAQQHHQLLLLHPDLLRFVDEPDPFTGRKLAMKNALLFIAQPHERQLQVYKRFRNKPSGEQYHAIRTTAVVKSDRTPSDDFAYVSGLLNHAAARMKTVNAVGEVMLRRFTGAQLRQLAKVSDHIVEAAQEFHGRLGHHEGSSA